MSRNPRPALARRFLAALALLAPWLGLALLGPGCSSKAQSTEPSAATSPRPVSRSGTPDRHAATYDAFSLLGYAPQWNSYARVATGRHLRFLDAQTDAVVAHESGNTITVLESTTGARRWALDLESPLAKFVGNVRRNTEELLSCSESEVFFLDIRTGVIKARQHLAVLANTRPVHVEPMLVFGCTTGEVLGHSMRSGYKQWGYALSGTVTANPVPVGADVAVVSQAGEVVVLDPRVGRAQGSGSRIFGGLDNHPVADDSTIYIASTDQSVWAFDRIGGRAKWRHRTDQPLRAQPTLHAGRLMVYIPGQGITAFEASSGSILWKCPEAKGSVIAVRAGRLLEWDPEAKVAHSIDPLRGEVIETAPFPGVILLATDSFVDGSMYAAGAGGLVQKFSPKP